MTTKKGFTLIELLVVIAIIALLLSIIMPALHKARVYAQKIVCANYIKQQCLGTSLYASDQDAYVPNNYSSDSAMNWLIDMGFWATTELARRAGFEHESYKEGQIGCI